MTFINLLVPNTYNVRQYGAIGDGITDDTSAIQAAIVAASSTGPATVYFPAGTYLVSSTIQLHEKLHYLGELSDEGFVGTTIKQANGSNLDAVLASVAWYTSQSFVGYGFVMEHITVDGNKSNQTGGIGLGIVSMNYNSYIRRCAALGTRSHGIVLAAVNRANWNAGTPDINNTLIQCYITDCTVAFAGGSGIYVNDASGGSKDTDHFICNNIVHDVGGHGIVCDTAAGTVISGNHTYSTAWCGITAGSCFGTRITNNYIDGYGTDTSASQLAGIQAYCIGPRGSIIANNQITALEPSSTTPYWHLFVIASDVSNPVYAIVANNHINGNFSSNPSANTSHSLGMVLDLSSSQISGGNAVTYVAHGNSMYNCGVATSITGNALVTYQHFEDGAGNLQLSGTLAVGQSSLSTVTANGTTITTANTGSRRVTTNGSNYTGCILQAGTYSGQQIWIVNEHATNTIAWATQATSHVAGESGGTFVVGALKSQHFVWNSSTSLWYKSS